jgi:chorismate mutase
MPVRGIRGAISIEEDQPDLILEATRELLEAILQANPSLVPDEIASITFTLTPDLCSSTRRWRPAKWAGDRSRCCAGWKSPCPDSLPKVLRVLIHWNTDCRRAKSGTCICARLLS